MSARRYAIVMEPAETLLQDRALVVEAPGALIVAVADGAGGAGRSERAAEAVVREVEALGQRGGAFDDKGTWTGLLEDLDAAILRASAWGQTTAVVLAISAAWVCGASVGDSEAWIATPDHFRSLTAGQRRKPLLGSGEAVPVPFRFANEGGVLIVGSDGLFKYAPAWKVAETARGSPPEEAIRLLLDLVRMPNGRLQDDVGLVVLEL